MFLDCIIIGGGPAGLLSQQILSTAGYKTCCIVPNLNQCAPQAQHVHFFGQGSLQQIDKIVPGFIACLSHPSVYQADSHGLFNTDKTLNYPWPGREQFDQALSELLADKVKIVPECVTDIYWIEQSGGYWQVVLDSGRVLKSTWLIDASGRSRVSLRAVGQLAPKSISIQEGPQTGTYVSCYLSGVQLEPGRVSLKFQADEEASSGILLLRQGEDCWQITVQIAPQQQASGRPALDALLKQFPDSIQAYFTQAKEQGKWYRYGGQASNMVFFEDQVLLPDNWLILGDALLATPPYQGRGIDHLMAQLKLLEVGIQSQQPINKIRSQISDYAQTAWLSATMTDVFKCLEVDIQDVL